MQIFTESLVTFFSSASRAKQLEQRRCEKNKWINELRNINRVQHDAQQIYILFGRGKRGVRHLFIYLLHLDSA